MSEKKNKSAEDNFEDEIFDVEGFDNVIVLNDEDGNEEEFELLDIIIDEGNEYIVLTPVDSGDNADVIILECEPSEDDPEEEIYSGIEDEKLLKKLFQIFKERNKDNFNFAE